MNAFTDVPSTSPTTDNERCVLREIDIIKVFTDWRKIVLGLGISFLLTLPALSIYCRSNDDGKLKQSYFYSCMVKYITCFFGTSVLVGSILDVYRNGCWDSDISETLLTLESTSFIVAVVTEVIEFMFDFGRLVVCYGHPDTLDFYQNVRWNSSIFNRNTMRRKEQLYSDVDDDNGDCIEDINEVTYHPRDGKTAVMCCAIGLSSLPIAFLMFILWQAVFLSNLFGSGLLDGIISDDTDSDEGNFFQSSTWLMILAIYMTISFSCIGGYYLLRMICTCDASSNHGEGKGLGFYWGQFKVISIDIPSLFFTGILRPSSLFFFWTVEFINDMFPFIIGILSEKCLLEEMTNEADEKAMGADLRRNRHKIVFIPFSWSTKSTRNTSTQALFNTSFPSNLMGKISETSWKEFAREIELAAISMSTLRQPKWVDRFIKLSFITLGIMASIAYWSLWFSTLLMLPQLTFWGIAAACSFVGGFICIKVCFGRDMNEEREIFEQLEQVCIDKSSSSVQFMLDIEEVWFKWFCRGGISCERGLTSIKGINCIVAISAA
jgi:hypothetical protein